MTAREHPKKPAEYLAKAIRTLQPRTHDLVEMASAMNFYMVQDVSYDPAAAQKFLTPNMIEPFRKLIGSLESLELFNEANLESAFHGVVSEMGLKLGKVAQPVRVALTGSTVSPGLFEIIDVLGKEAVLGRLRRAVEYMSG